MLKTIGKIAAAVVIIAVVGVLCFHLDRHTKRRHYGVVDIEARLDAVEAACRSYGLLPHGPTP